MRLLVFLAAAALLVPSCAGRGRTTPHRSAPVCGGIDDRAYAKSPSSFPDIDFLVKYYRLRLKTRTLPMVLARERSGEVDEHALAVVSDRTAACQRIPGLGRAVHLAVLLSGEAAMRVVDSPLAAARATVSEEALFAAAPRLKVARSAVGSSKPGPIAGTPAIFVAVLRGEVAKAIRTSQDLLVQSPTDTVWDGFTVAHLASLLHEEFAQWAIRNPRIRSLRSRGFGGVTVAHVAVIHHGVAGYALLHPEIYTLRARMWLRMEGCTVAHAIAALYPQEVLDFLRFYPDVGRLEARAKGRTVTVREVAKALAKEITSITEVL